MDALGFAQRTRQFFSALFGSKLVVELRAELDDARTQWRAACTDLEETRRRAEATRDAELQRARNEVATPLRKRCDDLEQERNYFRGRVERLEMRIDELLKPPPVVIPSPREHKNVQPTGRKLWGQIQSEHRQKIAKQLQEAEEQKARDKAAAKAAAAEAIH